MRTLFVVGLIAGAVAVFAEVEAKVFDSPIKACVLLCDPAPDHGDHVGRTEAQLVAVEGPVPAEDFGIDAFEVHRVARHSIQEVLFTQQQPHQRQFATGLLGFLNRRNHLPSTHDIENIADELAEPVCDLRRRRPAPWWQG